MAQSVHRQGQTAPVGVSRQTPGITAVGWLLICFAAIPILFGIHQFDRPVLVGGGVMAMLGLICVFIGRVRARRAPEG